MERKEEQIRKDCYMHVCFCFYFYIIGLFDLCQGGQTLTAAGGFRLSTNEVCVELLRFPALSLLPLFLCLGFCSFSLLFFSLVFSSIPWLFFSTTPPHPTPPVPSPCTPDASVLLSSLTLLSVWSVLTQGSIQALIKKNLLISAVCPPESNLLCIQSCMPPSCFLQVVY